MATVRIPLRADLPAYNFRVELDTVIYILKMRFNERFGRWIMDIKTEQDVPILLGIPLFADVSLTTQYEKSDLPPGQFVIVNRADNDLPPGRDDLGGESVLLYEEALA